MISRPLFVALLTALSARACDVGYDFGNYTDVLATKLKTTATWWTVEPQDKANVYLSTAISTGCNSGYFGSQFHSDGNASYGNASHYQTVLFSMWDNPEHVGLLNHSEFAFQALPASGNCWRNALDASGKSTGVQCGQPWVNNTNASQNVSLHFGVPYEFTLAMTMQNKSGALWEVHVFDPVHKFNITVGKIFFVDAPLHLPKTCRNLGKAQVPPTKGLSSYSFLEYFNPPFDYTTHATWSDMAAFSPNGTEYKVKDITKDCCGHTYAPGSYYDTSRRCVPPECDSLHLHMMCGPYVKPSRSAMNANPGCNKSDSPKLGSVMHDCWKHGTPKSLDQCFGEPRAASAPLSGVATVV